MERDREGSRGPPCLSVRRGDTGEGGTCGMTESAAVRRGPRVSARVCVACACE